MPVWDMYVQRPVLPTLFRDIKADVCIVGLGGSGLSAALHAAELGYSVVGIDSKYIAAEAAGRNGGFLLNGFAKFYHETRKQLGADENRKVYLSTINEIKWIKDRIPGCVRETGVLRRAESEEELEDCYEHFNWLIQDGFEAEHYDGEQGVGIVIPSDGVFNPVKRTVELARLCIENGVKLFQDTPAIAFDDNTVITPYGRIEAKVIIVAVDGYMHKMFPQLKDVIFPVRLQMASTQPTSHRINLPVYSNYGYDYWQQMPDGRVVMGGGRQIARSVEYTDDRNPTETVQQYLKIKLSLIGVQEPIDKTWAGIVGYTHDGLPVKQEVYKGVWAVGGYNGTGNLIGPVMTKQVINEQL